MHLRDFGQEMEFQEFIAILDVLDYTNGEVLFSRYFVPRFFVETKFSFIDDFDTVIKLARIFIK